MNYQLSDKQRAKGATEQERVQKPERVKLREYGRLWLLAACPWPHKNVREAKSCEIIASDDRGAELGNAERRRGGICESVSRWMAVVV
jgi:hypothetical protein